MRSAVRGFVRYQLALLTCLLASAAANGQVTNMPPEVQKRLAEVGPVWGKDVPGNIEKTLEVYTPVLASSPKDGVRKSPDHAYGPNTSQKLDLYLPEKAAKSPLPIVVYIHGGAFVAGERDINKEVYGNVPTYFAKHGAIGVNATYRLAPKAQWPAGSEDVASMVKWIKTNIGQYGGDPGQIYLIGHSAGATHVSNYLFDKRLYPDNGPGVKGGILLSGRYHFAPKPNDPSLKGIQAYMGTDASKYKDRSPLTHLQNAPRTPLFIAIAEYDNPGLDTQGAMLLSEVCKRDGACPRFLRMEGHNHLSMVYQFNTKDDQLGREILSFMRLGR